MPPNPQLHLESTTEDYLQHPNPRAMTATKSTSGPLDNIKARRQGLAKAIAENLEKIGPAPDHLEEHWLEIPLRDGTSSGCKVTRPRGNSRPRPLIVYFHPGGFTAGNPDFVVVPARDWAAKYNAVVVAPSYRLFPEIKFPVPLNDAWDVTAWLSENAASTKEVGADLSAGFVMGGVSAGAACAGVCAGVAALDALGIDPGNEDGTTRKKLSKPLTGVFVMIPLFLSGEIVPEDIRHIWTSRDENRNAPFLDKAGVEGIIAAFDLKGDQIHSPWFSPINAMQLATKSGKDYAQPPTYIGFNGKDPLRDDGTVSEKMLQKVGVVTKSHMFPDDAHAAYCTMPFPHKSKDPSLKEGTIEGMGWVLDQHKATS